MEEFDSGNDLRTVISKEREFEAQLPRTARVKEDDLESVFLGDDQASQPVKVSTLLELEFWEELSALLREFKDIFFWDYTVMKGLDPKFYQHRIYSRRLDAILSQQQRYHMNPHVAKQVKEELDRLLKVGFIAPIENWDWISPMVIVPKKNKKMRICVDYRKLNATTVPNPFLLPYMDSILDEVAGHAMYSFLDGFTGYNQVCMAPED